MLLSAGPSAFEVVALAAGRDVDTFAAQIDAAGRVVALSPTERRWRAWSRLRAWRSTATRCPERFATRDDVDMVIVATGGIVSLRPVLAALRAGKVVATANKETLVAGGHLVMPLARGLAEARAAATRRPHGQPAGLAAAHRLRALGPLAVPGRRADGVRGRLILTASGGPFRDWPADATGDGDRRARRWRTRPGPWAPRSPSTRRRS